VDALEFGLVGLGGGVPGGVAVVYERLHHGLVGQPLDARGAAVQVAHFGRFFLVKLLQKRTKSHVRQLARHTRRAGCILHVPMFLN
jgi:hypothetical protein